MLHLTRCRKELCEKSWRLCQLLMRQLIALEKKRHPQTCHGEKTISFQHGAGELSCRLEHLQILLVWPGQEPRDRKPYGGRYHCSHHGSEEETEAYRGKLSFQCCTAGCLLCASSASRTHREGRAQEQQQRQKKKKKKNWNDSEKAICYLEEFKGFKKMIFDQSFLESYANDVSAPASSMVMKSGLLLQRSTSANIPGTAQITNIKTLPKSLGLWLQFFKNCYKFKVFEIPF